MDAFYWSVQFIYGSRVQKRYALRIHFNGASHLFTDPEFRRDALVFEGLIIEPVHEVSNKVVCATSKTSDQPAHTHSLIRAFASPLRIL